MQRLPVRFKIAGGFSEAARPQPAFLSRQKPINDSAERLVLRPDARFGELRGRIPAEPDASQYIFGGLYGPCSAQALGGAERHAPLLGPECVLHDPVFRTPGPQPQTKARQIIVEIDRLGFPGRED